MILDQYVPLVEDAIRSIGVPIEDAKGEEAYQWFLQYNSVKVMLMLKISETLNGERPIFIAVVPVMPIPKDPQQLASLNQEILEFSHHLVICRFSIAENHLFMSAGRFVEGMDSQEVLTIMEQLAINADAIDEQLKERYANF